VPQRVKDAACELAFQFVKAGTSDIVALDPTIGITQKVVGPLSTTYASPGQRAQGLWRFPSVTRFLRGLLAATPSANSTIVRG
jgi:hypothetical protein